MPHHRLLILALSIATLTSAPFPAQAESLENTPVAASTALVDLGNHTFKVTTKSPEAQRERVETYW